MTVTPSEDVSGGADHVTIRLIDFPLPLYHQVREHLEELVREFAILTVGLSEPDHDPVPRRLLDIIARLTGRYGSITESVAAGREEAIARGERSMDLHYRLPRSAQVEVAELAQCLAEVDDYCRRGALLTLATPTEGVVFRSWYLGEITRQIDGAEPVPWPAYAATHGIAD